MKYIVISILLFTTICSINAQVDHSFYFNKDIKVNTEILEPGQVSGHTFGEWHFSHDQLVNYMKYLADKSKRVKMVEYGRTHENRPLYLMLISSAENLSKIDDIRKKHLEMIFSKDVQNAEQDNPIIVWLGYGVHGNESSASNSSLLTTYYLSASQEEHIINTLEQSIIIIDPSLNPDGFNRAASWVNMHQSENWIKDQKSVQFSEDWPGGRTNHYWFDLNRDWLLAQHPESKARLAVFHKWKPAILTDHHEMGTNGNFFFQPGVPSRNNPLTPDKNYTLTYKIGTYHSKALDNIGSLYFSEESFDDFYYGKGSSYPDVNGTIGILFEQSRVNGQVVNNTHGTTTFAQAIRNQFTVAMSTVNAAIENKKLFQDYQREFYQSTEKLAKNDNTKGYVFACKEDPVRLNYFLEILNLHQIDVYHNKETIKINELKYSPNEAFVVPLNQNQYRLIKSIFDVQTEFKDSLFYDVSTWTFPLAFNIDSRKLTQTSNLLGEKLNYNPHVKGKIIGEQSNIGYIFNWSNYNAPKAVQHLFNVGVKVKVARKPSQAKINGKVIDFNYGSIFIPVTNQDKSSNELFDIVRDISEQNGIETYALENGFRHSGIHFGSSNFAPLNVPKILMLIGNGINSRSAGEIWHLLDHRLDIPITRVNTEKFGRIDLFEYNTLIVPGGEYEFGESESKKIETWLKNGGKIIAVGSSAKELSSKEWINLNQRKDDKNDTLIRHNYASARDNLMSSSVNGVILKANIDNTHPIGYGFTSNTIPVFKNNGFVLEKNKDPYSCPVYIPENPLLSGYLNQKNKIHLQKSAYVLNYSVGSGKIIVFADNPNFRGYWYGTNKLFVNAIFFGDLIRTY